MIGDWIILLYLNTFHFDYRMLGEHGQQTDESDMTFYLSVVFFDSANLFIALA